MSIFSRRWLLIPDLLTPFLSVVGTNSVAAARYGASAFSHQPMDVNPQDGSLPYRPISASAMGSMGGGQVESNSTSTNSQFQALGLPAAANGTNGEPFYVALAEPSFRSQLWKSVRGLGSYLYKLTRCQIALSRSAETRIASACLDAFSKTPQPLSPCRAQE